MMVLYKQGRYLASGGWKIYDLPCSIAKAQLRNLKCQSPAPSASPISSV